jgi:hypothetical protein
MKMAKGSEDQLKVVAVIAFLLIAAVVFYFEYFYTGSSPAPAPAQSVPVAATANSTSATARGEGGPAAKAVGTTSASLDPTLHMDAMLVSESVEYSGTGRNIFSATSVPVVPIPSPIASARPKPQIAQVVAPQPTGPPPPPPIDLKYFGIATAANGVRKAFLLHDDIVYTASAGDVVLRR